MQTLINWLRKRIKNPVRLLKLFLPFSFCFIAIIVLALTELNFFDGVWKLLAWGAIIGSIGVSYAGILYLVRDALHNVNEQELALIQKKENLEIRSKNLEQEITTKTDELNRNVADMEMQKTAMLNIMEDVDETNRQLIDTQEQLKGNLADLKQLDVQKDQFISIAAHELKTPLTSIRGFADLLRKDSISENPALRKKYLEIIFKDTKRLGELISNILDLSRMDIGTLKMSLEEVSVASLMEEVKEQMDIIIKGKGLDSEFSIEGDSLSLMIDQGRTIQVISNLINNAVHYTEQGKVSVHARCSSEDVLFSVSDTGSGIPEEHMGKLFTRFYQVDSPLTRKIGGTGLGLSLCKGFVEAMGGTIWIESKLGKGSIVFFTLPINPIKKRMEINLFEKEAKAAPQKSASIIDIK